MRRSVCEWRQRNASRSRHSYLPSASHSSSSRVPHVPFQSLNGARYEFLSYLLASSNSLSRASRALSSPRVATQFKSTKRLFSKPPKMLTSPQAPRNDAQNSLLSPPCGSTLRVTPRGTGTPPFAAAVTTRTAAAYAVSPCARPAR